MHGYQEVIEEYQIKALQELRAVFDNEISKAWVSMYCEDSYLVGDITTQNFFGYTFVFDHTDKPENHKLGICSMPDSRVIGVYGISNSNVNQSNRDWMKKSKGHANAYDGFGGKYDRGHFIAHLSGGPIDINLFPQRRDVNRGWKGYQEYRNMEKYIAANPGIFVFSKAVYDDFSCRPSEILFGYCDTDLKFTVRKFPNKY